MCLATTVGSAQLGEPLMRRSTPLHHSFESVHVCHQLSPWAVPDALVRPPADHQPCGTSSASSCQVSVRHMRSDWHSRQSISTSSSLLVRLRIFSIAHRRSQEVAVVWRRKTGTTRADNISRSAPEAGGWPITSDYWNYTVTSVSER